jgi:hypothetical protein
MFIMAGSITERLVSNSVPTHVGLTEHTRIQYGRHTVRVLGHNGEYDTTGRFQAQPRLTPWTEKQTDIQNS